MLKLRRYLKPYLGLLIVGIVLLFIQAMTDLELPNVMSEIVNTGIQKGGITEAAPEAIGAQAMDMMQLFMPDVDKAIVMSNYVPANAQNLSAKDWADFTEKFPAATEGGVYRKVPNLAPETETAVQTAFSRASYALVQHMQAVMPADTTSTEGQSTPQMDTDTLAQMLPMLAQDKEGIQQAIDLASATPPETAVQTAAVFVKAFYKDLGANTDSIQTKYILNSGAKMLLLCIITTMCAIATGYCLSRLGAGVARDLRRDLFTRVTHFATNEMDQFSTASLMTRTTNDITQIQMFLTMGLRMLCFAPIMGIGGVIMAVEKSASMAWLIALAVILVLGLIIVLFSVAMPRFKVMQDLIDRLNLVSRENLSGMMVIRAFATQKFEEDRFDKANKDLAGNTQFVNRAMATMMPAMMLIMNAVTLLVVWVGAQQIANSGMQVGDMMAFMQYAMQVIMSFLFISMMFVMVPRASVSAMRIHEVIATESTVRDPAEPKTLSTKLRGEVTYHDVTFHYAGADENVLEHISFTAKPGETTAFIGSTGSGKSTLINLLPRFYDVSKGSITVDGVDVRDVTQHALREKIGYVPQKGMLFSGTVASNLRYGGEHATDATLEAAAETAQAMDFITELENGFDAPISQGGTNVSGGQRQRLSIARALVKRAPIYIFDDTFSALDFKTDAKLRRALKGYTGEATVLIVAQRISSIMHAEQIIVLDQGHIAGIGTHAELLKNCETYREIAQSQLSKEELA